MRKARFQTFRTVTRSLNSSECSSLCHNIHVCCSRLWKPRIISRLSLPLLLNNLWCSIFWLTFNYLLNNCTIMLFACVSLAFWVTSKSNAEIKILTLWIEGAPLRFSVTQKVSNIFQKHCWNPIQNRQRFKTWAQYFLLLSSKFWNPCLCFVHFTYLLDYASIFIRNSKNSVM